MRDVKAPMDFADMEPEDLASRIAAAMHVGTGIRATPYSWPDPRSLPTRQWLLGHWLLRGEVTAIIAPGGTGKSTIGTAMALSLASGRPLLGKSLPRGAQSAWIYNLEDSQDELDRQVSAACLFHGITAVDCAGRLFVDSGLIQPLCTATEDRDGFALVEDVFTQVAATIRERGISAVIVDPFVSSHTVHESSNEAINAIAKRWKRLAQETGCAVVLVHHTKKLGGREVTAEDGRGAVALRDAARVVLPLNAMSQAEAEELGITDPALRRSLVRVDTGKANRAPPDAATWIKLESQCLENGDGSEPADYVGVATLWEKPDVFHGLSTWHLYMVQKGLAAGDWRESVQAKDWVGHLVANVAGLSAKTDKGRIKAIIRTWRKNGALAVETRPDKNGDERPFVIVGKAVDPSEIGPRPHLEKCGAESAGGADDDPR
ncbi:AAA family ATPase [Novosphingobium aerophilum]|uniref:AAA family ATPase n=1 Tax=Novosphingobium aerophilum TaxID=2839843 RepID=A0A7X1F6L6_9SPHN|nr:AAA family ATPase [Novosphingobium aerophilum]MBC2651362.1 AAA family ATPase [Novosphingobium aerophilum]